MVHIYIPLLRSHRENDRKQGMNFSVLLFLCAETLGVHARSLFFCIGVFNDQMCDSIVKKIKKVVQIEFVTGIYLSKP
ncbi:hypothetical protein PV433_06590 [Paenibacillus sp. GYB004]|uniref:hypothetical protein n=1 Tax=Paenibacillus sp. GYB004 TaxID=2994393 RepID=UPI002F963098